MNKVIVNLH